jgi:hypothetical protein
MTLAADEFIRPRETSREFDALLGGFGIYNGIIGMMGHR